MVITTLDKLKAGDTFRYIGSDEQDWHTVIEVKEDKIYYPGNLKDRPQTNHRTKTEVILKEG